jgi:acetyl-CoA acetyltransferase
LAVEAIMCACEDAGVDVREIDGFSSYSEDLAPYTVARTLGLPAIGYAGTVWGGGGGGSCAAVGNAAAAIHTGQAEIVVLYHVLKRTEQSRFGGEGAFSGVAMDRSVWCIPHGLLTPAQAFALIVRRHMHEFGTTEEDLGRVAIAQRHHAMRNPQAVMRSELTMDAYLQGRMIADPFRLYDCTLENDGAAAVVITSAARANSCRRPPAYVLASAQGGFGSWAHVLSDHNAPDEIYASAGQADVARRLYQMAGVRPSDIDVAQLYDHFSGMVLLALEDLGFCGKGESGPFVAAGHTQRDGSIPVNTHGGNLSEANLHGTTHIIEGVRQIRGTSSSQVPGAELCLVTGGPSPVPTSAMLLSGSPS